MTNPSELDVEYRVIIAKRYSFDKNRYMWQVRVFKKSDPQYLQLKFESNYWDVAMAYGDELARIFK